MSVSVDVFDLTGKRALVVGAAEGVPPVILEALTAAGARVFGLVPNPSNAEDGESTVRTGLQELGGLEVVVSCLGRLSAGPIVDLSDADLVRSIDLNLAAPVRLVKAAGRHMLQHGGGRIVQVVSLLGERGVPNTALYGACQAGLIQLVKTLSLEWARHDVRINAIGLGWMEGDPLVAAADQERASRLLRYLPAGRLGRPDDVGAVAVYLASDAADMMTGQTLWIDGAILSHA